MRIKRHHILVAIIALLTILLLFSSFDANRMINDLVKRNQQQSERIEQLQRDNERLEKVIVFQYEQMKEKQKEPIVQPIIHKQEQEQIHNQEDVTEIVNHPTTIIATLLTFGKTISSFLPKFQFN